MVSTAAPAANYARGTFTRSFVPSLQFPAVAIAVNLTGWNVLADKFADLANSTYDKPDHRR